MKFKFKYHLLIGTVFLAVSLLSAQAFNYTDALGDPMTIIPFVSKKAITSDINPDETYDSDQWFVSTTFEGDDHPVEYNGDPNPTKYEGSNESCSDGILNGDGIRVDFDGPIFEPNSCHPDKDALLILYDSIDGPNWTVTWDTTSCDPCSWHGITCDMNDRVIEIILYNNNLSGTIPDTLDFPYLEYLSFSSNQLTGEIPDIAGLPLLVYLDLGNNQFTDTIPNFSNLSNLENLDLTNNTITGEIPDFTNFPNLIELILDNNQLTGEIPDFNNLPQLFLLQLSNNLLTGDIPNFSNLSSLAYLVINDNQLSGSIPNFSNLPNLEFIELRNNQLSGVIPDFSNLPNVVGIDLTNNLLNQEIPNFSNLPNLNDFAAGNNQLFGSIPNFSNLPNLIGLDLNSNILTGEIPDFANSPMLYSLNLGDNQLSGSIPNFSNIINFQSLKLNDNLLSGCFHPDLIALCNETYDFTGNPGLPGGGDFNLFCLDNTGICVLGCMDPTAHNYDPDAVEDDGSCETCSDGIQNGDEAGIDCGGILCDPCVCTNPDRDALIALYDSLDGDNWTVSWDTTGCDPCSWYGINCDMNDRVIEIMLYNNNLSGTLPDTLDFPFLTYLSFSSNQLTGGIPDIAGLSMVNYLDLGYNQFTDTIPDFTNLPSLEVLDLNNNVLSGEIPDFTNFSNLVELLLDYNQLTGEVPDFSSLPNLFLLHSTNNLLTGGVPDFSSLSSLGFLVLSDNQLTGNIPDFTNLPNLEFIELGNNQLGGGIPDFSNLPNLIGLLLNNNSLTGEVPDFTSLPNLSDLVAGNNQLTGSIPNFSGLPNLTSIVLNNNLLTGEIPDFTNSPMLFSLDLGNNQLTGSIPVFPNILNFQSLVLNDNLLSGCFHPDLIALCNETYDFTGNPGLPGGGDFNLFCLDNTGICVLGCMDPTAHNYDPDAVEDDGSCETCSDGIQNGDETGIDCGGILCAPCLNLTCLPDSIQEIYQTCVTDTTYPIKLKNNGVESLSWQLFESDMIPIWIEVDIIQGDIIAGDSSTLILGINTTGLISGTYEYDLVFINSDTSFYFDTLNITFELSGDALKSFSTQILDFGVVETGMSYMQSFEMGNGGCDTIDINSFAFSGSDFNAMPPTIILPYDTTTIDIYFNPMMDKMYQDTLIFNTNYGIDTIVLLAISCTDSPVTELYEIVCDVDSIRVDSLMLMNGGGCDSLVITQYELPDRAPTDGLIAYYPFSGNTNDESGNNKNGILNGALYTTDRFGKSASAMLFDGQNDYIEIINNDNHFNNQAFSITAFVRWEAGAITTDGGGILSVMSSDLNQDHYALTAHGNKIRSWINYPQSSNSEFDYLTTVLQDGQFHHIAATYDGVKRRLYIDGVLVKEGDFSESIAFTANAKVFIGADFPGGDDYFKGVIDELRIYDRPLSDQDIARISADSGEDSMINYVQTCNEINVSVDTTLLTNQYGCDSTIIEITSLQNPISPEGLVAYYPFDGNPNDMSGYGNDGMGVGAFLTEDRFGNVDGAYSFDGVNDYIDLGNQESLKITSDKLSISAWIQIQGNGENWGRIVLGGKINSTYSLTKFNGSDDRIIFRPIIENQPIDYGRCDSSFPLERNRWYHIAVTYDGSATNMYIDGTLDNTTTNVNGNLATDNLSCLIGGETSAHTGNIPSYFNGDIDEVMIFNRAMDSIEIQQLYLQSKDPDATLITQDSILNYGNVLTDDTQSLSTYLTNTTCDTLYPMYGLGMEGFTLVNAPPLILPYESINLEIAFTSPNIGVYYDTLSVDFTMERFKVALEANAIGRAEIELSDNMFQATITDCLAMMKDSFYIYNSGTDSLNFTISSTAAYLSVLPDSGKVPEGDSVIVYSSYDVAGLSNGTYIDTLTIESDDGTDPLVFVNYEIRLEGPSSYSFSSDSLDFRCAYFTTTKTDTFWLFNDGCDAINVDSTDVPPGYFFDELAFAVLPNDSIPLFVAFDPDTIQVYNDSLKFYAGNEVLSIFLKGEGVDIPKIKTLNKDSLVITMPKDIDPNSLADSTLIIWGDQTGRRFGMYSVQNGDEMVFVPNMEFRAGERVNFSLTSKIKDNDGFQVQNFGSLGIVKSSFINKVNFVLKPTNLKCKGCKIYFSDYNLNDTIDIVAQKGSEIFVFQNSWNYLFSEVNSQNLHISSFYGLDDFNNDGYNDLMVLRDDNKFTIYKGSITGHFNTHYSTNAVTSSQYSKNIYGKADYDSDGFIDYMKIRSGYSQFNGPLYESSHNRMFYKNVDGQSFVNITNSQSRNYYAARPSGLISHDFNKNGLRDFLFSYRSSYTNYKSERWEVINNQLEYVKGSPRVNGQLFDSNSDGYFELMHNSGNDVKIYTNDPVNSLNGTSFTIVNNAHSLKPGDINGDGYPDIVLKEINTSENLSIAFGNQSGIFSKAEYGYSLKSVSNVNVIDIDNDNDLDIAFLDNDGLLWLAINEDSNAEMALSQDSIQDSYSVCAVDTSNSVQIYNNGDSTLIWQVNLPNTIPEWMTIDTTYGQVPGGDSLAFDVHINTMGLASGMYNYNLVFNNNDTTAYHDTLHVAFEISSDSVLLISEMMLDFGLVDTSQLVSLDLMLTNKGCDTITVDSSFYIGSLFSTSSFPITILPFDQETVTISLDADQLISYEDTLVLSHNYGSFIIPIMAQGCFVSPVTELYVQVCTIDSVSVDSLLLMNQSGCDSLVVTYYQLPDVAPTIGLVAYLPFDGNALDESGNGNDGSVSGAFPDQDRFGNENSAYSFNGNGWIRINDDNSLDLAEYTLSAWIKPSSLTGSQSIISHGESAVEDLFQYYLSLEGSNVQSWYELPNDDDLYLTSTSTLNVDTWYLVTTTRSSDGAFRLYVNDQLEAELLNTDAPKLDNDTHIYLGRRQNNSGNQIVHQDYYNGIIDDARIYNRSLSQLEITRIYEETLMDELINYVQSCDTAQVGIDTMVFDNQYGCDSTIIEASSLQTPISPEGLLAYYPFDGNPNDMSGYGNDGMVNGAMLTEDRFGNVDGAYGFDGNDHIQVSNNSRLNSYVGAGKLSIAYWIKPELTSNERIILSKRSIENNKGFVIACPENSMIFTHYIRTEEGWEFVNTEFDQSKWQHIVFTAEANGNLQLYKNGSLVEDKNLIGVNFIGSDVDLRISHDNYTPSAYYVGDLDGVMLYSKILSPSEIQQLYLQSKAPGATIVAQDSLLDFETITRMDTATLSAFVTNATCDTILIDSIYTTQSSFWTEQSTAFIPPYQSIEIPVHFSPPASVPYAGQLKVLSTGNDTLSIALQGQGCDLCACPSQDVVLNDQQDIDDYIAEYGGCDSIEVNLTIEEIGDITDITGLNFLKRIDGNLTIKSIQTVNDLQGFEGLKEVTGHIEISMNDGFTSLNGLGSLTAIGGDLDITDNIALVDCDPICYLIPPPAGGGQGAIVSGNITISGNPAGCSTLNEVSIRCDENCPNGNYILTSQAEVDAFALSYMNCDSVIGNLTIQGNDITDISGMDFITHVSGNLTLQHNSNLTTIDGLQGLKTVVGQLKLDNNDALIHVDSLYTLDTIGATLTITNNALLQNVNGISGVMHIGQNLTVQNNIALTDCNGLCGLLPGDAGSQGAVAGSITISGNPSQCSSITEVTIYCNQNDCPDFDVVLRNQVEIDAYVSAFSDCDSIFGSLTIQGGSAIQDISGLDFIKYIQDNFIFKNNYSLDSLSGLDSIVHIGGSLIMENNHDLTDISQLEQLTFVGGELKIYNNDALTNLTGLGNITHIGGDVKVQHNSLLSDCSVICILLELGVPPPGGQGGVAGQFYVNNNPSPCSDLDQVEAICTYGSLISAVTIVNMPDTIVEGDTLYFEVMVDYAPADTLIINLLSSNTAEVPVPQEVIMLPGNTSVTITVPTPDDNTPEQNEVVTITAGAQYLSSDSDQTLLTNDDDVPPIELVISQDTISEAAGLYATSAIVRRIGSGTEILNVTLSSNSNEVNLPQGVNILSNEIEKSFFIGVFDNAQVDGFRNVNITATYIMPSCICAAPASSEGVKVDSFTISDNDGPTLEVFANPLSMAEGISNAGSLKIQRNTDTSVPLDVMITVNDTTEISMPTVATIPVGATFFNVPINTQTDILEDGNQEVTISVSSPGFTGGNVWVIVTDINKPDLIIVEVVLPEDTVNSEVYFPFNAKIHNKGFSSSTQGINLIGYLSKNNTIDANDHIIGSYFLDISIGEGDTIDYPGLGFSPESPGAYKLLFEVNPDQSITELLYLNNTSSPLDMTVLPEYYGTVMVDDSIFLIGEEIVLHGSSYTNLGVKRPNTPLEIFIYQGKVRRNIQVTTDANGDYSYILYPLQSEYGHFEVGVGYPGLNENTIQDEYDILGVKINNGNYIIWELDVGDTLNGNLSIRNVTEVDMVDVTMKPMNLPTGCQLTFDTIPLLPGGAVGALSYEIIGGEVTPPGVYQEFPMEVYAELTNIQNTTGYYYVRPLSPQGDPVGQLQASISSINTTMNQLTPKVVEFSLTNMGEGVSGDIDVSLPGANWIRLVSPASIASLDPGASTTVTIEFVPTSSLPLNTPATGIIAINADNANGIGIPFTIMKVSDETGGVTIDVIDQFTYFTDEAPHVDSARVRISNYFTGQMYADTLTGQDGMVTLTDLPEGQLRIVVDAFKHKSFDGVIDISPGTSFTEVIFLEYQAISFTWDVVPTEIEDEYEIDLVLDFEVNVPAPVVVISVPNPMPDLDIGEEHAFNVTLTNKGLITAKEVQLDLPEDPEYEFITNYEPQDILAQQVIQVPVLMRLRSGGGNARSSEEIIKKANERLKIKN